VILEPIGDAEFEALGETLNWKVESIPDTGFGISVLARIKCGVGMISSTFNGSIPEVSLTVRFTFG
jgi:hypothetical protein